MNNKERSTLQEFPKELDNAVNAKFGEEVKCESTFSIFSMGYTTNYIAKGAKKKRIEEFIEAYLAGNLELRNRMLKEYPQK